MSQILVYDFEQYQYAKKGISARFFDLANALVYCKKRNAELKLIEDQRIPYFADKWADVFVSGKWSTVSKDHNFPIWPNCPYGGFEPGDMKVYSDTLKDTLQVNPELQAEVEGLIQKTGFENGDVVVHIRWTDKTRANANVLTLPESCEQDINWYWSELRKYLEGKSIRQERIFICTDTPDVFTRLPKDLIQSGLEFLWDNNEARPEIGYCPKAFANQVTLQEQRNELLSCLKNLQIMQRASFLIGARCSYFFRVGELLRFPRTAVNVKDSDTFGRPEYIPQSVPLVRPCKLKCYPNFVN